MEQKPYKSKVDEIIEHLVTMYKMAVFLYFIAAAVIIVAQLPATIRRKNKPGIVQSEKMFFTFRFWAILLFAYGLWWPIIMSAVGSWLQVDPLEWWPSLANVLMHNEIGSYVWRQTLLYEFAGFVVLSMLVYACSLAFGDVDTNNEEADGTVWFAPKDNFDYHMKVSLHQLQKAQMMDAADPNKQFMVDRFTKEIDQLNKEHQLGHI